MSGAAYAPVRPADADAAAQAVEEILDRLEAAGGPGARAAGDDLIRALMRLYGAGLARILELVGAPAGAAPRPVLPALLADSQVAALLTLHDLHPEDLPTRVERALAAVPGRPFELVALDERAASITVRRAESSGCGCGSKPEAGRESVEAAVSCFAPEIGVVEVAAPEPAAGPLLQISTRPSVPAGAPR